MKTFFQLKEELDTSLYEMEMITHKKKIAAAQSVLDKAKAAHSKASDTHFKLSDAARKKHGKDSPQERAHINMAKMHKRAGQGDFGGSHGAATVRHGDSYNFHGRHVPEKHVDHAEKLHNNMVDAYHKLEAVKKASPLHKAKAAVHKLAKKVGMREAKVDEISDKKLGQYYDKATAQRKKSKDYFDKSWPSRRKPDVAKKHDDRLQRRHKGIGSVIKRDMAGPGQKYMTGVGRGERIQKGEKGASMTTKRADQLPKSYKKGTNK